MKGPDQTSMPVRVFDTIIHYLAYVMAAVVIFLMLFLTFAVATRYFLAMPIQGVIEISEYSLLYITFGAAPWVLKDEGHVKMDLILDKLSPRTQQWLNTITSLLCAGICVILIWYGSRVTWNHFQISHFQPTALRVPTYLTEWIIPAGSFLLLLQFLRRAYVYARGEQYGPSPEEEYLRHDLMPE